jgi:pimeloyl-ACP methyl ester carboxylesterase
MLRERTFCLTSGTSRHTDKENIMNTITEREAQQIAIANASGNQPVVFIHGLWLLASSWDAWAEKFQGEGYATVAVDWPGDAVSVADAKAGLDTLAGVGVQEITEHIAEVVRALDAKPIVIGHSFGGLLAQRIADLGLASATIAIDPAPFKGVLPLPVSTLKASSPVLANPANRNRTVTLTFDQFRYGFANVVSEQEAHDLYDTFHVAGPGRPLFQAASANLTSGKATKVDVKNPERGPLLFINGEQDHIVPNAVAHAAYKLQSKNPGRTEFTEIEGRGHSLTIDAGWADVANAALAFVRS